MDENRFDASLRTLASSSGRRATLRSLGVAAMAAIAGLGLGATAADNRKNNHGGGGSNNNKNKGKKQDDSGSEGSEETSGDGAGTAD